jgi:hypothetical protein
MARNWTPQQRKERAQDARRWKLWEYSTGPTTAEGRARGSLNSTRHGAASKEAGELKQAVAAFLASVEPPKKVRFSEIFQP